jgi:hypothetical protein
MTVHSIEDAHFKLDTNMKTSKKENISQLDYSTRILNAMILASCPGIVDASLAPPTIKNEAWQFYIFLNAASTEMQRIASECNLNYKQS